jgi:hypothetical protein
LDPSDRPIHFSLFDPDCRGLPFHRTAEFLTVPYQYRYEFLFRNPHCIDALSRFFGATHALAIRPRTSEGLIQADREGETFLDALGELRDRFGIRPISFQKGNLLDPPVLTLEECFPDDLPTLGKTVREERCFRKGLMARRRKLGVRAPRRQPEDYYKRLLAVWDAREGWLGRPSEGYDPGRALRLQAALAKAGAGSCVEDYYRAFLFVSGMTYSREAWLTTLGIFWLECSDEALRRRGTGRKRGVPAPKDEPIVRFLELVKGGTGVTEAARVAGLSGPTARSLSNPDNWDAVREFMHCPQRVGQLLASL